MVKYISTRDTKQTPLSFRKAVLTGLAPDRGLYVPQELPQLPPEALTKWRKMAYPELAFEVMSLFIPRNEIGETELKGLVQKSYNSSVFRASQITPVQPLRSSGAAPEAVLELFHGPTFAFKDIALQFLGNLFEYFLQNKATDPNEPSPDFLTVVGATSGDTGSSAIYGLRGKKNIEAFILYPHGRVSEVQEKQMTSVLDENIHNVAVKGTFDDCQATVKQLFSNQEMKQKYNLSAVNSINWARILAQIVYYVYAYFRATDAGNQSSKVSFSVPTGNFGDILAGFYAKKIGVPIGDLVVATNENDILHRFFSTGEYHRQGVVHTISPSMDICVSSNFERFLFFICGNDAEKLRELMSSFEKTGKLTATGALLKAAQEEMSSGRACKKDIEKLISRVYLDESYLLDPHTAIGVFAARAHIAKTKSKNPMVTVATAHYGKFLPAVVEAMKLNGAEDRITEIKQHPVLRALADVKTRNVVLDHSTEVIKNYIIQTVKFNPNSSSVVAKLLEQYLGEDAALKAGIVAATVCVAAMIVARRQ